MDTVRDVVTVFLLGSGLSFMLIGAWGVVRLPDAYHRLHASSKCSTLGLFGMLAGAVVHIGTADALIKAALTLRSEERRVGKECRSRWSPYH